MARPRSTHPDRTQLRELLDYDPVSGDLRWKPAAGRARGGKKAGHLDPHKGLLVGIAGRVYRAHNLIWVMLHGDLPRWIVLHRDGDRTNNRPGNLYAGTRSEASLGPGPSKGNTSGFRGVGRVGGRWCASIGVAGKKLHLGCFATPEEASTAYEAARRKARAALAALRAHLDRKDEAGGPG